MKYASKSCGHSSGEYVAGCEGCKAHQRERVAQNRKERAESGKITHGTRSGYDAGCRDDCCRSKRLEAYSRLDECARAKGRDLQRIEEFK